MLKDGFNCKKDFKTTLSRSSISKKHIWTLTKCCFYLFRFPDYHMNYYEVQINWNKDRIMLYCLIIICICIYIYIYISVWVYQLETWDNVLFCLFWFHTLPSNHVYVTGSNNIYDIRKWVTIMNQYTIMIRHR